MKNIAVSIALVSFFLGSSIKEVYSQPQLATLPLDSNEFFHNPDQIKVDTNLLSPTYTERFADRGFLIEFSSHVFSYPPSYTDTASVLRWQDIDSQYTAMRNDFEAFATTVGSFHFSKRVPDSTWTSVLKTRFYLYFDNYENINEVVNEIGKIPNVEECEFGDRSGHLTALPNDQALVPLTEWKDIVWDARGGDPFWPEFFHQRGWQWNHYEMKSPMAWEITQGDSSTYIAAHDIFSGAVSNHPDMTGFTVIENGGDGFEKTDELRAAIGPSGHGITVLSCAMAKGDNDLPGSPGGGMVGSCPNCRGLNARVWIVDDVDVDEVQDGVQTLPDIVTSSIAGYSRASWQNAIESGIVALAAAGNHRDDWGQRFQWSQFDDVVNNEGEEVRVFYTALCYPSAHVYTPESDPNEDYQIISVGAVGDGKLRNNLCVYGDFTTETEPHHYGPVQFYSTFAYGPGKAKFSVDSDPAQRRTDKENAYMDVVAPTGVLVAHDERPEKDCDIEHPGGADPESPEHQRWKICNEKNNQFWSKYHPYTEGTSQATPGVAGMIGLMLSINKGMGVTGADVQRKVYDVITFTADKIDDWENYNTEEQEASWIYYEDGEKKTHRPSYPDKMRFSSVNPTLSGDLGDGEPIQYDYVEQTNDPLRRWWAQRVGFGRVNAYRAVAHAIPLKGARVWNVSQTLNFFGFTPPTNENNQNLMHFGAYNDNNELVLEKGGEDLPGEDYNNQGITWINGTKTTVTVPSNAILAIDGLIKTDNPTGDNRVVSSGTGKILITGYLEDVEVIGNVRLDDLIIRGSSSDATGCVAIGDATITAELYGNLQLQDYGIFNLNKGKLQMKPGSTIDMQGQNDLVIKEGGSLEMEHASRIIGTADRVVVVESGCTLKVNTGVHADILAHVLVKDGGSLIIEDDAVVSINRFTVERNGELIVNKGARVALNDRTENLVNGRLHVLGAWNKRATITGRVEECCTQICTTVVDRASIRVEDDISDLSDRTSCNMKLSYANFSNVPIRTVNAPLYKVRFCNFSAKRSLFDERGVRKNLLDIRVTDRVLSRSYTPTSLPEREKAQVLFCDFFDEDGEIEGQRGTFNYTFTGLNLFQMKRAVVTGGDFVHLMHGVTSTLCDSVAVGAADFITGDFGVLDYGSILRICRNTFDKVEIGNLLYESNSSWIFDNRHNQTSIAFAAMNSRNSHYLRGNTFVDFTVFGLAFFNASGRLDIAALGPKVPLYSLWGRNQFMYNGNGTIFRNPPLRNADIGMFGLRATATLPCGYNRFAENTTWHLYSNILKVNYPVDFNEFLDPTGHAVRTLRVAWVGAPINVSATLPGCGRITAEYWGEHCPENPPPPDDRYKDMPDAHYLSDGGWVDIPWNDPYLNDAFWRSRAEMLDPTISTEWRLVKMHNALEAAILGDSVESTLLLLSNDYATLAADPQSPTAIQASAFLLQGGVQERLGADSSALLAYTEVTTNYANEPDSITASWRLQALGARQLDPTLGPVYDSAIYAGRVQILEDVRRILTIPDEAAKPVVQPEAGGSQGVAGERVGGMMEIAVLGQNTPNPVKHETVIPYRTMREMKVRLSVTNSIGEEVAVLVDGVMSAGEHIAVFSAEGLPGGLYFYHLEIGGSRETRGMSVQK